VCRYGAIVRNTVATRLGISVSQVLVVGLFRGSVITLLGIDELPSLQAVEDARALLAVPGSLSFRFR
jgi:hypothetical protein